MQAIPAAFERDIYKGSMHAMLPAFINKNISHMRYEDTLKFLYLQMQKWAVLAANGASSQRRRTYRLMISRMTRTAK